MRTVYRTRRQWAKCVGGRPGGPLHRPRSIGNAASRDITAPSSGDQGRPSPAPGRGGRGPDARMGGRLRCAPAPAIGCVDETQSVWRARHPASRASGARCGDPLQHTSPPRAARFRPATTSAPTAALPSRSSARLRCTAAISNGYAGSRGRSTGKPPPTVAPRQAAHAGQPCACNSRGATACPARNAGRRAVGDRKSVV